MRKERHKKIYKLPHWLASTKLDKKTSVNTYLINAFIQRNEGNKQYNLIITNSDINKQSTITGSNNTGNASHKLSAPADHKQLKIITISHPCSITINPNKSKYI